MKNKNLFFLISILLTGALKLNSAATIIPEQTQDQKLLEAVIANKTTEVEKLIKQGANVNVADDLGWTALIKSVEAGYNDITKLLIDARADVNKAPEWGWTALMRAAKDGNTTSTQMLLASGANPNLTTLDGWTSLMLAAWHGQKDTVKLLLEAGADWDLIDKTERRALDYANEPPLGRKNTEQIKKNKEEIIKLIESEKLKKMKSSTFDWHAHALRLIEDEKAARDSKLMDAVREGNKDKIIKLIEEGANVNAKKGGWSPLLLAGNPDIAKLLLSKGANIESIGIQGETPLIMAVIDNNIDLVKFLIAFGANINATDYAEWTPLIWSARTAHPDIATILIEAGADMDKTDHDGKNVDYFAQEITPWDSPQNIKDKAEIVKLLQAEHKKREDIKKRHAAVKKIVNQYYPPVLSPIITEYSVGSIEDVPESERTS